MAAQVVNLVSNDVRRFDDMGPYSMHIWAGPLEVICVLVMVGCQLTFPAAIAGIATLLLLIPFQVSFVVFKCLLVFFSGCLSPLAGDAGIATMLLLIQSRKAPSAIL